MQKEWIVQTFDFKTLSQKVEILYKAYLNDYVFIKTELREEAILQIEGVYSIVPNEHNGSLCENDIHANDPVCMQTYKDAQLKKMISYYQNLLHVILNTNDETLKQTNSTFEIYTKALIQSQLKQFKTFLDSTEGIEHNVNIHEMNAHEDGGINMKIGGEPANRFLQTLINFFEQNGGKNFLTLTLGSKEKKYAIQIINCNGSDSPGEKINTLEKRIRELEDGMR